MKRIVEIEDLDDILDSDDSLSALTDKLNGIFIDDLGEDSDSGIEVECGDISAEGQATKIIPSGCPVVSKAKEDGISLENAAEKYGCTYCDECETTACLKDDSTCKYFGGVQSCQVNCKLKGE